MSLLWPSRRAPGASTALITVLVTTGRVTSFNDCGPASAPARRGLQRPRVTALALHKELL